MKNILVILVIISTSLFAQNGGDSAVINKENIYYKSKIDSLSMAFENINKEVIATKNLIEILDKTNQQISLWSNPYGVFIAALGVLFTIMTFFFAGFFYLQSKEFKDRINKLILSNQTALNRFIEDWSERKTQIDKQIKEYQSKILETTDKQKLSELEKIVERLKIERNSISFPIGINYGPIPPTGSVFSTSGYSGSIGSPESFFGKSGYSGIGSSSGQIIKCISCNSTFTKPAFPEILTGDGKNYTKCPYCSADNPW
jgi:hypothetical protein